jgi:Kef-type K+ transport system membrane component KefB
MTELGFLVGCAAIAFAVARYFGIPAIPTLLVGGYVLGESGLLVDEALRLNLLTLGVGFLVFYVGTELNPARLREYRSVAFKVGALQFVSLGVAGFGVAILLGLNAFVAAHVALALTASSTLVVVRLLQQRRQMFDPAGRTVLGVLLLQDIIIILILPFLYRAYEGLIPGLLAIVYTLVLATLAVVMLRIIVPRVIGRLYADSEVLLLCVLAVLFTFVALAYAMGLPLVTGAFLAGVALSSFPASGFVRQQFGSVMDFFAALFFTILGTLAAVSNPVVWMHALLLSAVVIFLTPPLVTIVAERAGLSSRSAIESGLLLSQTSEISLILILPAYLAGLLSQEVLSTIILVTAFTMILTPAITTPRVVWGLMKKHPSPYQQVRAPESPSGHIIILGMGPHAIPLLETLLFSGYEVFVVDDDPALIEELAQNDVPSLRGDASDPQVLKRAGIDRARVAISMIRRPSDNRAIIAQAQDTPVIVRVFEEEDRQMVEEAGGIAVSFSEAAAEGFFRWLDSWLEKPSESDNDAEIHRIADEQEGAFDPGNSESAPDER